MASTQKDLKNLIDLTKDFIPFSERICLEVNGRHGIVEFGTLTKTWGREPIYTGHCKLCGKFWLMDEKSLQDFIDRHREGSRIFTIYPKDRDSHQ